jgi:SAM-dependent methyltransferase
MTKPPRDAEDPRAVLRRISRDEDGSELHGYEADEADDARVRATNSSPTYGEIMPTATDRLIEHLALRRDDVFYDLGSGVGKVVLHVALRAPIRRVVGVELARRRHRIARRMLDEVRATGLMRAGECELRCADFMRVPMGDATVVYTCSTAFSTPFMNELASRLARLSTGLRWVSTQDLDENPWFVLEDVLRLDMSWRRKSKVHVYRLERSRR